jgi:hypothetical protein
VAVFTFTYFVGVVGGGRDLVYKCWGYSEGVEELLSVGWWLLLCRVVPFCSVSAVIVVDEMASVVVSGGCNMLDIVWVVRAP